MTEKVIKIWKVAKKDKQFKEAILTADGDKIPLFPNQNEKVVIATTYYGYLIGKFGDDWAQHV